MHRRPDLIVLNLMLPILMLTARDDSYDQALGLELGVEDYITKPCGPRVLLACIRTRSAFLFSQQRLFSAESRTRFVT